MKGKRTNPAFTLVEVLVALALISTIVMMVYGSFTAATRSMDLYGRRLACADRASLVLRLLRASSAAVTCRPGKQIPCPRRAGAVRTARPPDLRVAGISRY